MINKLKEALELLKNNFTLIGLIILTVYTLEIILNNFGFYDFLKPFFERLLCDSVCEPKVFKNLIAIFPAFIITALSFVFYTLYIAALLYVISQAKQGIEVNYSQTMSFALKKWKKLLGAWFIACIYLVLGFIAFIIPCVILMIRYMFIDEVIVLEDEKISRSRKRSTELTISLRWKLLQLFLLCFIILGAPYYIIDNITGLQYFGAYKTAIKIILDYGMYFINSFFAIVSFLFYLDAKEEADKKYRAQNIMSENL